MSKKVILLVIILVMAFSACSIPAQEITFAVPEPASAQEQVVTGHTPAEQDPDAYLPLISSEYEDGSQTEVSSEYSYPIVDTGQVTCYDDSGMIDCPAEGEAFYGQDAQFTGNSPSYTDNGDGTITDIVTGLIWQKSADTDGDGGIDSTDKMAYDAAVAYCADLCFAGHDDWRLPTIKQLYSLIDFSGLDVSGYNGTEVSGLIPFIDSDYFDFAYGDTASGERIIDMQYASSTMYVSEAGKPLMFGVNFSDGRIKGYGLKMMGGDKTFAVICVQHNDTYGINDFVDNGDGTITDHAAGLMWAQDDSGFEFPEGLNWEEALAYAEAKNAASYLGYSDWRLPNVKELQSIVDYSRSPDTSISAAIDPLFNTTPITNEYGDIDYDYYWSSTTHANWTNSPGKQAAYISFGRGLGFMRSSWVDIHGAGSQRSDPKTGDPGEYPTGHGPQGDAIRIYNTVRLVRDGAQPTGTGDISFVSPSKPLDWQPCETKYSFQPTRRAHSSPRCIIKQDCLSCSAQ